MITIFSHGFKYGRPESNFMFDVSYLPNPYRYKDKTVDEVMGDVNDIVDSITNVILTYNNRFSDDDLRFAICCSAGEYRSPYIVNKIHNKLEELNIPHEYHTHNCRI